MKSVKNQIREIDRKIAKLGEKRMELKKKGLKALYRKKRIYCDECGKIYPERKCKINTVFEEGGWYDYTEAICPKKHEIIIDN